jgi:fumarylacetoacetase
MNVIDQSRRSWLDVPAGSDFPIQNLPYGVFETPTGPHIGIAIGEYIFDLHAAAERGHFDGCTDRDLLTAPTLDPLLAAGRTAWTRLRARSEALLDARGDALASGQRQPLVVTRSSVRMRLPFTVRDYVDFYSSLEHATNLGRIFRPGGDPLMPNWRWMPIGYHGRSSTVVVDGTPIVRPIGQRKPPDAEQPLVGPSALLDIELEIGFVTGPGNAMGTRIAIADAPNHIFGMVLVNDWSARDIQAWEYQPLGPFLGKSFATSVSPWVVTLDALEPFRLAGPAQQPSPLPYLQCSRASNYDVQLSVELQTRAMRERGEEPAVVSRSNAKYLYWNMAQQLAHATVNGTAVRPGDLYASGTISGPAPDSLGSFIEMTWRGTKPLALPSGERRSFLEDGDTAILRGYCEKPGLHRIGFGAVGGTVLPAIE